MPYEKRVGDKGRRTSDAGDEGRGTTHGTSDVGDEGRGNTAGAARRTKTPTAPEVMCCCSYITLPVLLWFHVFFCLQALVETAALQKQQADDHAKMMEAKDEQMHQLEDRLKAKAAETERVKAKLVHTEVWRALGLGSTLTGRAKLLTENGGARRVLIRRHWPSPRPSCRPPKSSWRRWCSGFRPRRRPWNGTLPFRPSRSGRSSVGWRRRTQTRPR